jgi:hypothetical protein
LELKLPFEDAGAGGGGFGLGNVAGGLKRDGERCVGERIGGCEGGEGKRGGDGLLELTGVAESANEAVMRFDLRLAVIRRGGDYGPKGFGGFGGRSSGEQVESLLGKRFGGVGVGFSHGCL